MVRETYNSSKRQNAYRDIFVTLNSKEPKKILKVCDTRWISLEPAVCHLLQRWYELKLHFEIVRSTENCYTAEMLFQMYSDVINYLTYLKHSKQSGENNQSI